MLGREGLKFHVYDFISEIWSKDVTKWFAIIRVNVWKIKRSTSRRKDILCKAIVKVMLTRSIYKEGVEVVW